jgi:UDP-N-acetylglucosamine 2-epimerase (non-hydrolysing)
MLGALPSLLAQHRPRLVVVHGDTATAYAAMLSAYLSGIPVAHIEAGLRTGDVHAPYPEEYFRRAIDAAADYFYAPTRRAFDTLLREGRPAERILLCGNTATDAVRLCLRQPPQSLVDVLRDVRDLTGEAISQRLPPTPRLVLLTLHRRELPDAAMQALMQAIADTVTAQPDALLLFPVHPSPRVRQCALRALSDRARVLLCEPLPLPCMQRLLSLATLLLTDSGGLQEEAAYLGIPTLVLRERTERPEGEAAGVLRTVGCAPDAVAAHLRSLLLDESVRLSMAHSTDVFGDGFAALRIASHLRCLCEA